MAKYLAIPTADGTSLANARLIDGAMTFTGLSNGTEYSVYRLSDTAATATPAAVVLPPANTVLPAITGTVTLGQTLVASTGAWTGSPTGYAYQWLRNAMPIAGATGGTYALQAADETAMISVTVTATNVAGSTAATSAEAGPVTAAAADWWTSGAYADLDYDNNRAYINGTAYASIAEARSAGAIVQTGGIDRMALPTLAASYAVAATGITGATLPSSTVSQYIAALDDGADGSAADELIGLTWATSASVGYANILSISGGVSQLLALPNTSTSLAKAISTAYRAAVRIKLNSTIASIDGTTRSTDTACGVPAVTQLVVGNRDDGLRAWAGTIRRIVFINAEIDAATLNGLLA